MAYMQRRHLQQMWRRDVHVTLLILYINITFIAQWLSGGNSEMLHGSNVCARRHKLCKPGSIFKQTRVNFFLPRKYDVISQLRHSYAKGPFLRGAAQYICSFSIHNIR